MIRQVIGIAAFAGVIVLSGVFGSRVHVQVGEARAAGRQEIVKEQALQPGALVDLTNVVGDIKVRPASGDVARLRAIVVAHDDDAARVRVEISADPRGLRARTVYEKDREQDQAEVRYTLELPVRATLRVHTVSGDCDIEGGSGADVNAVSGEVKLRRAGGEVRVTTVSGDVSVEDVAGRLRVQTVSGDVEGGLSARLQGGEVQTVSGEVELRAPAGLAIGANLSSLSGEIHNELGTGGAVPLRVQTVSGDIALRRQ